MTATMSILGLYRADPTIFDNFQIPNDVDPDVLQTELLAQCAELEVLYPDPDVMKEIIFRWSTSMLPIWDKLLETTQYKYDPISNYDRNESWTDTASSSGSSQSSDQSSRSDISSRTGFNVGEGMQPAAQTSGSDISAGSASSSGSGESKHTGHIYGNIGVTTTQAMIREQRDVVRFNIYQTIINDFEDRFCLMIY